MRSVFLRTHHIVDIVRRFPVPGITAQGLIGALRPLQPRLYSIASSLAAAPDDAHLTAPPVRYALHGEPRAGVASGMLADRAEPDPLSPVSIHDRMSASSRKCVIRTVRSPWTPNHQTKK